MLDKHYAKGQVIFIEKDIADGFYIVVEGKVKIFKTSMDGKEQILHIYGVDNLFGEVPVFSGKRFPANAVTLEQTHLLFLLRKDFLKLIMTDPTLSMNMLAELSARLRKFSSQVESISLKGIPKNEENIELNIPKVELASLLVTTPETLSITFKRMIVKKLLRVDGNKIKLTN